jgi:hypothetical protein
MSLHTLERLRRWMHPEPHVVMKSEAFAWPFDDLGQFIPDVESQVTKGDRSAPLAGDGIAAHTEQLHH